MSVSSGLPFISIVVPVFNAAATLEKCVGSLVAQTFSDIEIILVNNGSTDSSLEICRELSAKDKRIVVYDLTEKGVSAARNKGVEFAAGEFITFVDADDWMDLDVCKTFADLNSKNNYDLFCYSAKYHKGKMTVQSFLFADDVETFTEKQKEELQIKVFAPQAPYFDYKVNTRFAGSAWSKFYRRSVLLENNLRFSSETIISEDCLFNTLALDHFRKIGYTRKCFYHYVQQKNSAQNSYRPNSDKYFLFVIKEMRKWLQNTGKDQRFVDAANCLFVHYLFGILKEDLFHKDNKCSYGEKKRALKNILLMDEFSSSLKKANKSFFSIPEKILIILLQKKQVGIISFILKFVR